LRALLDHPMESGRRTDSRGNVIDANFLHRVVVKLGERELLVSDLGANLSKNPYFSFEFDGANPDDELTVEWKDNAGDTRTYTVIVKAAE